MSDTTLNQAGLAPNSGAPSATDGTNQATVTTQGNQGGNTETKIDYEKRYADSTREYQKLKEEMDKYKNENEPYVKVGTAFATRYQNDPDFKKVIDEKYGMNSATQATEGQPNGGTVNVQPTPEQAWAKSRMTEERTVQEAFYARLEGEDSAKLDKFSQRGADGSIFNPIRNSIGSLTRALMQEGMPFEKAATTAYARVMKPEIAADEAKIDGLVEGLTSNSIGVLGGVTSKSSQGNDNVVTNEDAEVLRSLGVDPSGEDYKRIAQN